MRNLAALLLLAATTGVLHAGPDDQWIVQLRASDPAGEHAMSFTYFGTDTDLQAALLPNNGGDRAEVYCYDLGREPPPPRWYKDIRAPMAAGQIETWHLIVTAGASYGFSQIRLAGWNQLRPDQDLDGPILVKLVVVSDPGGSYASGTLLWEFNPSVNGTSAAPTYTRAFNWVGQQIRLDLVAGESGQALVECTVGEARTSYVGEAVYLRGSVVTSTPADNAGLWVESEDGSSGIRIQASWGVSRGDRLDVTGIVLWSYGIPVLTAPEMRSRTAGAALAPRFAAGRSLAADPTETLDYQGINPVGLLAVASGQVTAVDASANVFYIDDGSRLQDGMGPSGSQYVGLRVAYKPGTTPPSVGNRVRVAGVRTVSKVILDHDAYVNGIPRSAGETIYVPVLATRDGGDVTPVNE